MYTDVQIARKPWLIVVLLLKQLWSLRPVVMTANRRDRLLDAKLSLEYFYQQRLEDRKRFYSPDPCDEYSIDES